MIIRIHNELSGQVTESTPRSNWVLPPGRNRIELCFADEQITELRVNGDVVSLEEGRCSVIVPVASTTANINIAVRTDGGGYFSTDFINDAFQRLEQELLRDLADFHARLKLLCDSGELTYGRLSDALDNGQVSLLVRPHVITDAQSDLHLSKILDALPSLQEVTHNPRRHLRVDEAVRPVAVVRRTGPAALRHLAQHSEHWQTRTVTGLRPARLLAKVIDDDFDLYENRFVVTLIKRLHQRLARLAIFVDTGLSQAQSAFDIDCYAEELMDPHARRMLSALLPSSSDMELLGDLDLFETLTRRITKVFHVLAECEETPLFRGLRQLSPVQNPIRPTNILTMDSHYRVLFDLWHELDLLIPENEGTGELPEDIECAYASFCTTLILSGLRHAGFHPENGEVQTCISADHGRLLPCGRYVRGDWSVTLQSAAGTDPAGAVLMSFRRRVPSSFEIPADISVPHLPTDLLDVCTIVNSRIEFFDVPAKDKAKKLSDLWHVATREEQARKRRGQQDIGVRWKAFIDGVIRKIPQPDNFSVLIVPILSSTGVSVHDVSENSESYLQMASGLRSEAQLRIVALPSGCREAPMETPGSIVRRLLNYGDAFFEGDSSRWAQRTGILQMSPWTLNSLQRVSRLIEVSMLTRDIGAGRLLDVCPVCESRQLSVASQVEGYSRECRQCGTLWGTNKCPWCSRKFPWLRLHRKAWDASASELSYSRWIEKVELAAGTKAFPSFCESIESAPIAVPICPHCGTCARKGRIKNCPRCSPQSAVQEGVSRTATMTT